MPNPKKVVALVGASGFVGRSVSQALRTQDEIHVVPVSAPRLRGAYRDGPDIRAAKETGIKSIAVSWGHQSLETVSYTHLTLPTNREV